MVTNAGMLFVNAFPFGLQSSQKQVPHLAPPALWQGYMYMYVYTGGSERRVSGGNTGSNTGVVGCG
jgi:hypothetical protein